MTYSEKLKDPRWQRRRLEKMKQADFACEVCADPTEELHVHHKQYLNGYEPWEYDNSTLLCLCRTCHELMHIDQSKLKKHCERVAVEAKLVRYHERLLFRPTVTSLWAEMDDQARLEWECLRFEAADKVREIRRGLIAKSDQIIGDWSNRNKSRRASYAK